MHENDDTSIDIHTCVALFRDDDDLTCTTFSNACLWVVVNKSPPPWWTKPKRQQQVESPKKPSYPSKADFEAITLDIQDTPIDNPSLTSASTQDSIVPQTPQRPQSSQPVAPDSGTSEYEPGRGRNPSVDNIDDLLQTPRSYRHTPEPPLQHKRRRSGHDSKGESSRAKKIARRLFHNVGETSS